MVPTRFFPLPRTGLRRAARTAATLAAALLGIAALVRPTQDAVANGDTRSLSLVHMHTGETLDVTYRRDGRYDPDALKKLNWFLRDWRREEPTRMDPRLFDTIWLAYREVGATQPIHVVCGYRAPETNAMLRRRSRGVAKFSQHTLGKAMDFYIPGVDLSRLRVAGLRLQRGGVGFYPTSGSPFVHMDAGSVRMWPKMTRTQLASVFPDGKTVHIPTDGKPMPGYQAAFAEVMRNGGAVGGFQGGGEDDGGGAGEGAGIGTLFAGLTGGATSAPRNDSAQAVLLADARRRAGVGEDAAPVRAIAPVPAAPLPAAPPVTPVREAAPSPAPAPAPVMIASADSPRLPVPLPEPRPAELSGPQMVWQTGPASAEAQDVVALASVPLPPARPGEDEPEDAPEPIVLASADRGITPLPPANPILKIAAPVMAGAASADTPFAGGKAQDRVLSFAAPEAPSATRALAALLPHSDRPQLVASPPVDPRDFAVAAAPTQTAWDGMKARLVPPDLKTVATLIPAPTRMVAMRFSANAYRGLESQRFSGTAIRYVATQSFALAPDIITGTIAN